MEKEVMGLKQTKHINEDKHKAIIELFPKYDLSQIFFEYSYLSSETLVELILDLKERHQLPKKPSYCLQILFKTGTFIDTVARRWPRWLGGCLIVKVVETIEYPFKSRSQQEARAIKESMECCICWERAPVEEMCFCDPLALTTIGTSSSAVQIEQQSEVHCFCKQCLKSHAEASADEMPLADSGLGLRCMTNDCENPITFFELKAFIPDELAKKLEERSAELSIAHAKLNNMERCRKCNCAVELGKTTAQMQVFTCPECKAQFCRLCDEPWIKEHEGISCEEFLRQNSHARLLEKRLSDIVVRKCPKCKLAFIKQEGCNHITCKCGHTQCYICRVDNINHDHFCSCSGLVKRNSDGTYKCPTCSKTCLLFENPALQEQRQMETIRKKAREEETKKAAAEKKKKKFVPVTVAGSSSLAMKASNKVNAKANGLTSISAKSATMTNGNGKGVAAPKKTSLFGGWL